MKNDGFRKIYDAIRWDSPEAQRIYAAETARQLAKNKPPLVS